MHEAHMVKHFFEDILKLAGENRAEKVTAIYLRMGEFTEINEEILRAYFAENGKGTLAEAAKLNIEKSPARELRLISFDCE